MEYVPDPGSVLLRDLKTKIEPPEPSILDRSIVIVGVQNTAREMAKFQDQDVWDHLPRGFQVEHDDVLLAATLEVATELKQVKRLKTCWKSLIFKP